MSNHILFRIFRARVRISLLSSRFFFFAGFCCGCCNLLWQRNGKLHEHLAVQSTSRLSENFGLTYREILHVSLLTQQRCLFFCITARGTSKTYFQHGVSPSDLETHAKRRPLPPRAETKSVSIPNSDFLLRCWPQRPLFSANLLLVTEVRRARCRDLRIHFGRMTMQRVRVIFPSTDGSGTLLN